jgi:DNA polymerase III delta subunit
MFYFFTGTDTEKARSALAEVLKKHSAAGTETLRITDAHTLHDLIASLQGGGLFSAKRTVVLDHVLLNPEMRAYLLERFQVLRDSPETFYIYESVLDAATRKSFEKYAETSEKFDLVKTTKKDNSIFELANALQRGKKKELWVGYQREIMAGKAPEAIHGTLFWGVKQMIIRDNSPRARLLLAQLAEIPHEARRKGCELEYALEHFVLSIA